MCVVDEEKGSHSSVGKWHSVGGGVGAMGSCRDPHPDFGSGGRLLGEKEPKPDMKNEAAGEKGFQKRQEHK